MALRVKDILEQVNEATGKNLNAANVRVYLRKLAADEVIEKGEGQWSFEDEDDPAIQAVIDRINAEPSKKTSEEDSEEDSDEGVDEDEAPKKPAKKSTKKSAVKKKSPKKEEKEEIDFDDLDLEL